MTVLLDRNLLLDWYDANRRRSAEVFDLIAPHAFYDRPIPLRHPFVFYEGHLPAFSFNTLCRRGLGEPDVDAHFQQLFERGIDPSNEADAQQRQPISWPSREALRAFADACDDRVRRALLEAQLDREDRPSMRHAQSAYAILEHEPMHHETLLYIVHQLPPELQRPVPQTHRDNPRVDNPTRHVPEGIATLGVRDGEIRFAWDNEMPGFEVEVAAFDVATYPVTNGDWLRFLERGGPVPEFWRKRDGAWFLRTLFEEIPLPLSWPVYVTHQQATAYASWAGMRLPSEAQFHRAAFGTPDGRERAFPWGDEPPTAAYGNFDFRRYDPEPVDANPRGESAWGVRDLIGNGWEWTSTPFTGFDGFAPMASYPQYSADFFDGRHYVMKGASPVTSAALVRRSFRNWFYDDYPYAYAKFRCVAP